MDVRTELDVLLEILLEHDLQKNTQTMIRERIKAIQEKPVPRPSMSAALSGGTQMSPVQPPMQAQLTIPQEVQMVEAPSAVYTGAIVNQSDLELRQAAAKTPEAQAAMNSRNQAIMEKATSIPFTSKGPKRKF